jgi:tRNA(Ile2) C34 agmatinyltransferase TiaS
MSDQHEEGIVKYGVEIDSNKVKTAEGSKKATCPRCGKTLDDAGACPEHGTEPFEPAKR